MVKVKGSQLLHYSLLQGQRDLEGDRKHLVGFLRFYTREITFGIFCSLSGTSSPFKNAANKIQPQSFLSSGEEVFYSIWT